MSISGVINDSIQDNLSFLEEYSNSILNQIAELHVNDGATNLVSVSYGEIPNQDEVIDQLSTVQTKFNEIFELVSILKKNNSSKITSSKRNIELNDKSVKLNKVVEILEPFKNGSIYSKVKSTANAASNVDPLALKEIELVGKLEKLIVLYALLSLYQITLTQYLNYTVPLNDDIFYWDIVSSSTWRTALYSLQTLPERSSHLIQSVFNDLKKAANPNVSTLDIQVPQFIVQNHPSYTNSYKLFVHYRNILTHSLYNNILANNIKGFYKSLSSNKNFNMFDIKKNPPRFKNYLSVILGAPFVSITQEVQSKKAKLIDLQSDNAKKLGSLITNVPNLKEIHNDSNKINESLQSLNFVLSNNGDSTSDLLPNLYNISNSSLPKIKKQVQSIRSGNSKPSFLTRYWPSILLTGLYGPSAVITVITNKDEIINFIQNNLIETVKGFWKNWILKPVSNILSTIRHDDNSEISIMSQKSLDSDLESLKRMVIEYTLENSPDYKNLKSTDLEILKQELDKLVSSGDLTPLMKDYENDIKNPLKNLIKGKLTRALLIQLQKTKVDGAVAINGIDKLLKSQELVFGIVAASPSLVIVVYLLKAINSYIQKGYISRGTGERKLIVSKNLNNIQRLLNKIDEESTGNKDELNYTNGMLLLEIISLRNNGLFIIPKNRRFEWLRDVNDLNDKNLKPNAKLNTIQRIYNTFGHFIN